MPRDWAYREAERQAVVRRDRGHSACTVVHELADAVVIADPHGVIVFWNDAATNLFGWSAVDARGRSLDLIIPERLRERHWVRRTGRTRHASVGPM